MKKTIILLLPLVMGKSFASDCLTKEIVFERSEMDLSLSCKNGKSLSLKNGKFYYPFLDGGYRNVRYWEGSILKPIVIKDFYTVYILNECNGNVVDSYQDFEVLQGEVEMKLENPNLSRKIKASYELVPMTSSEAKDALLEVEKRCKNADTWERYKLTSLRAKTLEVK